MKLKVGRYGIGPNVLMNVAFIGFLIGLHIGVIAAAHSNGKHTPWLPFLTVYSIVIPALIRRALNEFRKENSSN